MKTFSDGGAVPAVGQWVRSTTTRGRNVGVEGKVIWRGEDRFASTAETTRYRVGIEVPGELKPRYMPADKVEVIDRPAAERAAGRRQRIEL